MANSDDDDAPEVIPVGDPVCWLDRVCTECGALIEGPLPGTCWRCGAAQK
ncbi:hypothetical protein [Glaciihabitans sp. UYNi722]